MKYNCKLAKTIDSCATLMLIIGIIISLVEGVSLCIASNATIILGIGVIVIGILLSGITCLLITGFARLLESTFNLEQHFCDPTKHSRKTNPEIRRSPDYQAEIRCPLCGTVNNQSAVFCINCGSKLK